MSFVRPPGVGPGTSPGAGGRAKGLRRLLGRGGPASEPTRQEALRRARRQAYLETAVGLGALVALGFAFFRRDPGFLSVDPHPYWLVVIAIAARYGARPGYLAGALAALAYLAFALSGSGPSGSAVLVDVVLFLIGGAALGELRESQIRAHARLAGRLEDVEDGLQDLAGRYLASMELTRELERRVVDQTSTVTTLYGAAKALERLEIDDLSPSILELTASFVEAESCSVYLRRDDAFALAAARPERASFERPEELDTGRGVAALAVGERRTATVRDVLAEASPAQMAREKVLMATPLLSEDREVMGVVVVERIPFLRFTPATVKLFSLLGDWASSAMQRALRFRDTRDRNIEDELTGAYNYPYMLKRLEEEISRSRRYGTPLTVIAARIGDHAAIEPVRLPGVLRTVSLVLRYGIRTTDVLGKHAAPDAFLIALPHTDPPGARILADRLEKAVADFGFKPFGDERDLRVSAGVAAPSEGVPDADALIEAALQDAEARAERAGGTRGA